MPLPSLPPLPNPTDVRTDAIAALIDRLGIAKASILRTGKYSGNPQTT